MKKGQIIEEVIAKLKSIAGAEAVLESTKQNHADFMLRVQWEQQSFLFTVVVKNEIRRFQLPELVKQKNQHEHFLLVAHKIYPNIREELQEERINYLEANGNMLMQGLGLYVHIDGKPSLPEAKKQGNRAFTKTGLRIVFVMLNQPVLLNATQRLLAQEAGVALGNVPYVLEGLLKEGYIVRQGKGLYAWRLFQKLLDKWANEYITTLKPTLKQGNYNLNLNSNWQQIEFVSKQTCWGGEAAGDLYTQYLNPEIFTVYTTENRLELMKHYGWKPKENGEVQVFEKFWTAPVENNCVPALLAYADLMANGDKRSTETAKILYERHLQNL